MGQPERPAHGDAKPTSAAVALCIQGTQAEFERRLDDARQLFKQAWDAAVDDHDACVAAHYVAHLEEDPHRALHWDQVALERARRCGDARVEGYLPSLYVNLGKSHERVGDRQRAEEFYALAASLGLVHQD